MFLEELKYIEKEKIVVRHITEDIESFSSNSDENRLKLNITWFFDKYFDFDRLILNLLLTHIINTYSTDC